MMFSWCAIVLLTLVPVVTGNSVGGKVKLTQKGLDYIVPVAVNVFEQYLRNWKNPDETYGGITDLQIKYLAKLNSKQTFVPKTGVTITINCAKLDITGKKNSETVEVTVNSLSISATAAVKSDETGQLTFSMEKCDVQLERFQPNFNNRLYNILVSAIQRIFRKKLICDKLKTTIDDLKPQLETLNDQIREKAGIEYLMGSTVISHDSLELSIKDIFFRMGQPKETHLSPIDFTMPSQNTKMVYIGIAALTINTLITEYHKNDLLFITITDDMVPSVSPIRLSTTTFGAYIPKISEKYPNHKMMLKIKTEKEPVIKFESNRLILEVLSTVTAYVIQSGSKLSQLFVLNLEGSISVQGTVDAPLAFSLNKIEASIKETNINTFEVKKLNSFLNMVIKDVAFPIINAHLVNLPVPPIPLGKIHLLNSKFEIFKDYLLFGTDLQFQENTST